MNDSKSLKKALVSLIASVMGKRTSQLFEQFYHDDSNPQHLIYAAEEILTEFVGSKEAKNHLESIRQKFF